MSLERCHFCQTLLQKKLNANADRYVSGDINDCLKISTSFSRPKMPADNIKKSVRPTGAGVRESQND
jgi:hypothetical protein